MQDELQSRLKLAGGGHGAGVIEAAGHQRLPDRGLAGRPRRPEARQGALLRLTASRRFLNR